MRIIFHLGTYKTGTSSLQNTLFENRELLLDHGILYPSVGLTKDGKLGYRHSPLVYDFMRGKNSACPDALLRELDISGAETAIISSEAWSSPSNLTHLTRLVTALEENGHKNCVGVLSLRNLVDYQVSHYREFTVNQKNSQNYRDYIKKRWGLFDYLFMVRSFNSIFESRLATIPFDGSKDITMDLFNAMGFGKIYSQIKRVDRANVKSVGPLEIEAIRCANLLKMPEVDGLSVLSSIISENIDFASEVWTERFIGDTPIFTSTYRKKLQRELNWSEGEIDNLLHKDAPQERNVQEISDTIINKLRIT